jgi:hypothetical protein
VVEGSLGHGTEVDRRPEPFVKVVHELTTSAIRIEGRNVARVRIESDKVVAQEGFRPGRLRRRRREAKARTAAIITKIFLILRGNSL